MKVRDWDDVVAEVVESNADPSGWRAVAGDRSRGLGEDLYLGHPRAGVFLLKTYAKNPFEVRGVGTRVARSLDDEIGAYLPQENDARFAIRSAPEDAERAKDRARRFTETVRAHADAPTTPDDLFADVMEAIESPAFGPMEYDSTTRPARLDGLSDSFEEAESVLNAELDDLIDADEVGRGFY